MSHNTQTDVDVFMEALNAGIFKEKLAVLLSSASNGVALHGGGSRKGNVKVEFGLQRFGQEEQAQIVVTAKISHATLTQRGKRTEEDSADTVFYVGRGGQLSVTPPKEDFKGQYSLQAEKDGIRAVK